MPPVVSRPLSRRRVLVAAAVTTAALVLAACGSAPSGDLNDLSGVTLRVGDQVRGNQSVLEAAGGLDDLPYEIEWANFTAGPPLLEALNAGAIDVGGVGDSPPVLAQAGGIDARIVSVQRRDRPNDFLLARPGSGITSAADLAGRTVAVARGSSAHGLLIGLLDEAGVPQDAVTIDFLAPPDAQSAFGAGQIDAWAVWNPYVTVATESAGARIVADGAALSTGQVYNVASTAALEDPRRAAAISDLLARLVRAQAWSVRHPDEWVPIHASLTTLPEPVAAATFATSQGRGVAIDDEVIARQQALADRFTSAGLVPRLDVRGFFDDRFNDVVTGAQAEAGAQG